MCHQSVGLIQGAIEATGIPTISISVRPEITTHMCVSRGIYVRFLTGNPVGEPDMPNQQRTILRGALQALDSISLPGTVLEMPYRWRRMPDEDIGSALPGTARSGSLDTAAPASQTPAYRGISGNADLQPAEDTLYPAAKGLVDEIEGSYTALMDAIDAYRGWLEGTTRQEQAQAEPDDIKLRALNPQLRYLMELQGVLEGPAHDGLVRVSDRVVRIQHWEDGVFI